MQGNKGSILLMDPDGKPLLTIRRKKMSLALGLGENWLVYDGEETTSTPRFSVKKSLNLLNNTCLASVLDCDSHRIVYEIEGSYPQRRCAVLDENRMFVSEISRKEVCVGVSFGTDVFLVVVNPDSIRPELAMALVILLDQML